VGRAMLGMSEAMFTVSLSESAERKLWEFFVGPLHQCDTILHSRTPLF